MDYTYRIEENADGLWTLAPEGGGMSPSGVVGGTENPQEMADFIARNQSVATGPLWRVRVWTGGDADTTTPSDAEHLHDARA